MEKILVAGANGTTGKKIISILKESNKYEPIAMVRKEEQASHFKTEGVKTMLADLENDVSQTTNGIDRVIFAAGSGGKKVMEVDQEGAKKLMDASKEKGVKKFVMLSSMGADNPEKAEDLKEYLKAKHNADEYLKQSGVQYTIVRPGALTNNDGKGKISLENKLNKQGEISRSDVAETLVASLEDAVAKNKTFEILEGETYIKAALEKI
ncbi:NmrA-like family protein [Aequorivita sublithincola DSM 14238]|uniref:NmrA-like family protein n=1 Tax=Aequorivita sublithincola (strain DSM 14238 / LMG 21431 / ACAM 643 / 9-3) TaxID=746697 RepID=I3YRY1_AEQSU|nr:SDR family oxidoreductase [Aequorivita sublithincola]AFL79749.1 NmrA-like family protein [Aequorivita sublithincola DSM 14238]